MHKYMRAIGFSKELTKDEIEALITLVIKKPDDTMMFVREEGGIFSEAEKDFAYNVGICVRGEGIPEQGIDPEYYFPYIKSSSMNDFTNINIERHADTESYAAICEDFDMNTSVIFYLQNAVEYLNDVKRLKKVTNLSPQIGFSGLCNGGTIIFPVVDSKRELQPTKNFDLGGYDLRDTENDKLIEDDSPEAQALMDINTYHMLTERVKKEDIYSIVQRAFIPYGIECDQYLLIGEILNVISTTNRISKEKLWVLKIRTRRIIVDVCINQSDLIGVPSVGMRFKGNIWLQGYVALN